ncbi:RidA family protein [Croceicoccus mobilis]|uniref:Enamine deaminase RidA n=1 Tax=Croceicoccus mobilis TaxID=1703339 RepID=A0A916Z392_9SPHN|nr:RidA family protein [Croceicoccus mobilis]GGD72447.1 enamine deaminase RidA [Croceicoccus mobilis]
MAAKRINPASLYESVGYGFSHAALDEANGTLHLAGQVAWDKDYNVIGEDVAAQARQALANIKIVLEEAGSSIDKLLRLRTYIVDYDPSKLEALGPVLGEFYGDVVPAPNSIIGVQALALPPFLIEIEAIATV